jgi:AraC-like DNA-binding protein
MARESSDTTRLAADALSSVLQDLRLSAAHYCQCEVAEPWGIDLPRKHEAMVHLILAGHCWLEASSLGPTPLQAGDVVILPHGSGHRLLSTPGAESHPIESLSPQRLGDTTYRLTSGGTGPKTQLVCCGVRFEAPAIHPLLELMPPVLLVRNEADRHPMLHALLAAMADELRQQRIGAATIMARLADVIVTHAVRGWIESHSERTHGWSVALRDPQIGRALAAFHGQPDLDWSVSLLAASANLSRSVFSERFTATLGTSPARYVARWRMHLASTWLRTGRMTVADIATRLGYASEASFSRTFKRLMGSPPASLRPRRTIADDSES